MLLNHLPQTGLIGIDSGSQDNRIELEELIG